MRKVTAKPDGLLHRAGRCVIRLETQLNVLAEVLATLQRVINQGDAIDPNDITSRLRWVEHKEAELARSLDAVTAQTSELMRQLDATSPPEAFSAPQHTALQIAPFPEDFQQDMDQSFQHAVAAYHSSQPVQPQVFTGPQDPSVEHPKPLSVS